MLRKRQDRETRALDLYTTDIRNGNYFSDELSPQIPPRILREDFSTDSRSNQLMERNLAPRK